MEREIKQDITIVWPAIHVLTAIVIVFLLLAGGADFFQSHDWRPLALLIGVSVFSIWFVQFALRTSLVRSESNPRRWLLTDEGLVRVYVSGQRETIRWEQIQDMRWGQHLGLKIRWEETGHPHRVRDFQNEFRKWQTGRYWCWIRVREAEARTLFQCAKKDWVDVGL